MGGQVAVLGALGARLYQVQVHDGARYTTLADENRISARMIAPPRGRILDRFGIVVAGNSTNWRAVLVAEQADNVPATLDAFSALLPLSEYERARIDRELHRKRKFIPVLIKEFLTWDEMAAIEVNAPDLPGIAVDAGTSRSYPFGPKLAHVIGYVAPPNEADVADDPLLALPGIRIGRAGMEKYHDLGLRGRAGAVQLEVNAVGRVIRELDRQEGVPGEDVGLTIDSGLQEAVLNTLGDRERQRGGDGLPQRRGAGDGHQPVVRSVGVQLRRLPGAVAGMDQRPAHAADQQGDVRPVCAGLHLQDWRSRWRAWSPRRSRPPTGSSAPATSTWATRGFTAGARAGTACWTCAAA